VSSVEVDGLTLPVALGGHAALDFCNTRAGWGAAQPKEYLRSHAHLAVWARENGLLPAPAVGRLRRAAAADPAEATAVLGRAIAFRSALYAVLLEPTPGDWAGVNAEVSRAAAAALLRPGRPARWDLAATGLAQPLLAIAWHAAELLTSPLAGRVFACPGDGCGWLFGDPRGRRRWCSMAVCGNRAKVRRHAARQRETGRYDQPS
jgi:predicted RNA-binding Zn ribbon-like protein